MEILLLILKLAIGIPVGYLATDAVMQNISYSFYKGDRQLKEIKYEPEAIQINDKLTGYGYNLEKDSDNVIYPNKNIYTILLKFNSICIILKRIIKPSCIIFIRTHY